MISWSPRSSILLREIQPRTENWASLCWSRSPRWQSALMQKFVGHDMSLRDCTLPKSTCTRSKWWFPKSESGDIFRFSGFHVQLQKGWEVMSICGDERWLSQSLVMIKFAWSIIHINVLFKFDPKIPKFWFSMEKSCQGWSEICKLFNLRNITQNQRSGGYTWRALWFVTSSNRCKLQQSKRSGHCWGS